MTDETGSEEKSSEVAGPLAALKKAGDWFRTVERLPLPFEIAGQPPGMMAEMCERAAADLEEMMERAGQVRERTREVASPSALFRAGHGYGFQRGLWNGLTEEDQEKAGEAPPPTWEAAWALVRAQLATGGKI